MGSENFIETFTGICQRRRNGILTVKDSTSRMELQFSDGRLLAAMLGGSSPASEISARLFRAGLINERVFQLVHGTQLSVAQLQEMLVGKRFVSASHFARARAVHETNLVLAMRYFEDPQLDFVTKDIRHPTGLTWTASPAELLLSMFELESDAEIFHHQLLQGGGDDVELVRCAEAIKPLSSEERVLWEMLAEPKSVGSLFASMLTELEVTEGLLALFEQGLIETVIQRASPDSSLSISGAASGSVVKTESGKGYSGSDGSRSEIDEDSLDLAPEIETPADLYQQIASQAIGSMLEGFDELALAVLEDNPETPQSGTREAAALPNDTPPNNRPETLNASSLKHTGAQGGTPRLAVECLAHGPGLQNSTSTAVGEPRAADATVEIAQTFSERLLDINVRLSGRESKERLAALSMVGFLLIVLLLSLFRLNPLEGWLKEVDRFTLEQPERAGE